jgi:hypothetical protein
MDMDNETDMYMISPVPACFKGTFAWDFFTSDFLHQWSLGSTKNMTFWVILILFSWPSKKHYITCIELRRVESYSVLTQFTWSLTPYWLSLHGVSLRINSFYLESHSILTQFT